MTDNTQELDEILDRIYEGDIVSDGYNGKYGRYVVRWGKVGWSFVSDDGRELEVIGNIHENRELLND